MDQQLFELFLFVSIFNKRKKKHKNERKPNGCEYLEIRKCLKTCSFIANREKPFALTRNCHFRVENNARNIGHPSITLSKTPQ